MKIEVRLENETVWLTQQHMAELFQTTQQNISLHLQNIYEEGELQRAATHKESLSVRQEGNRQVNILTHAGRISHQMARELAEAEYNKFNRQRIQQVDAAGGEFEKPIQQLPPPPRPEKKGGTK